MDWKKQFVIIGKIIAERLASEGKKYTLANAAELLDVKIPKLQAWGKGQRPNIEDVEKLVQSLGISVEWLILGKGNPTNTEGSGKYIPEYSHICDTLREIIYELPDDKLAIARVGGITVDDLDRYTNSLDTPSALTISKWIHAYRINANFLLAQVGHPGLSEAEYEERGPLTWFREERGDFDESQDKKHDAIKPANAAPAWEEKSSTDLTPFQRELLTYKQIQEELGCAKEEISQDLRVMLRSRFSEKKDRLEQQDGDSAKAVGEDG